MSNKRPIVVQFDSVPQNPQLRLHVKASDTIQHVKRMIRKHDLAIMSRRVDLYLGDELLADTREMSDFISQQECTLRAVNGKSLPIPYQYDTVLQEDDVSKCQAWATACDSEIAGSIIDFYSADILREEEKNKKGKAKALPVKPEKATYSIPTFFPFSKLSQELAKRSGEPTALRWIHLPSNNMAWVEEAIAQIYGEHAEPKEEDQSASILLQPSYWSKRQYSSLKPHSTSQGRFMKSSYTSVPSEVQSLGMQFLTPKKDQNSNSIVLMPFIDHEILAMQDIRKTWVQRMTEQPPRFPTEDEWNELPTGARLLVSFFFEESPIHDRRTLDQAYYYTMPIENVWERDREQVLFRYSQKEAAPVSVDEVEQPPSEPEPDSEHRLGLRRLRQRRKSQRLISEKLKRSWKKTPSLLSEPADPPIEPSILMVDQLWLWTIDTPRGKDREIDQCFKTVVTAFPRRWKPYNHESGELYPQDDSNVHESLLETFEDIPDAYGRILRALYRNSRHRIVSATDLVCLIIDRCSSLFHPFLDEAEDELDYFDVFAVTIGQLATRQTALADALWDHSAELKKQLERKDQLNSKSFSERSKSYGDSASSSLSRVEELIEKSMSALADITEETQCLKEVKDVLDELNSILYIFDEQISVVTSIVDDVAVQTQDLVDMINLRHPESGRVLEFLGKMESPSSIDFKKYRQVLTRLIRKKGDLETLKEKAYRVYKDLNDLLDLKQKQATVSEAMSARQEAKETARQGRAILTFTIITIVFLPLSFIAAIFSMNAREINPDSNRPIWHIMAIMFTITPVIVVVSLALASNPPGQLWNKLAEKLIPLYARHNGRSRPAGSNTNSPAETTIPLNPQSPRDRQHRQRRRVPTWTRDSSEARRRPYASDIELGFLRRHGESSAGIEVAGPSRSRTNTRRRTDEGGFTSVAHGPEAEHSTSRGHDPESGQPPIDAQDTEAEGDDLGSIRS